MKYLAFFLAASCGFAQTAVFPGAAATDAQLKVAKNLKSTYLMADAGSTDTLLTVRSNAGFSANMLVSIGAEIIAICGITGATTLQVGVATCPGVDGRGFDQSTASAHPINTPVEANVDAWHHMALVREIQAIEGYIISSHLTSGTAGWFPALQMQDGMSPLVNYSNSFLYPSTIQSGQHFNLATTVDLRQPNLGGGDKVAFYAGAYTGINPFSPLTVALGASDMTFTVANADIFINFTTPYFAAKVGTEVFNTCGITGNTVTICPGTRNGGVLHPVGTHAESISQLFGENIVCNKDGGTSVSNINCVEIDVDNALADFNFLPGQMSSVGQGIISGSTYKPWIGLFIDHVTPTDGWLVPIRSLNNSRMGMLLGPKYNPGNNTLGTWESTMHNTAAIQQLENGAAVIQAFRYTDTNPSGLFLQFMKNDGVTQVFNVDMQGGVYAGTVIHAPYLFANMFTSAPGAERFCSDCTPASKPCTGGGTGAWAFSYGAGGTAWNCPF